MKILELKVMSGPNYWSVAEHKLIVMRVDVTPLENFSLNTLKSVVQYMESALPGVEGTGLLKQLPEGSLNAVWAGHMLGNIVLHIQKLAGMETGYYRVRPDSPGSNIIQLIFSYTERGPGIEAGERSVYILNALLSLSPFDLAAEIRQVSEKKEEPLGPSTRAIVDEAVRRNIPYRRLDCGSFIMFGYGANQKRIQASVCDSTSNIGVDIAGDKEATKELLEKALIPVPRGMVIKDESQLGEAVSELHFPLVVKPINGNHGRGITTDIDNREDLREAFLQAKAISRHVIVEKFVTGHDFRLLVVNYKLVAAALRTPACITGNGISTITELVEEANRDPRRGEGHSNLLTKIVIDDHSLQLLGAQGFTPESILPEGSSVFLKDTGNISTGGTATDITDSVHPQNVLLAERIARIIGLDICGIDIMAPDLVTPVKDNGGCVIEVNAAPGLRMHISPSAGKPRNVAAAILDMLFPYGKEARIPIVGITGTNGKTTTTRLMAHLAATEGYHPGFTTTDGIYIGGQLISKGDSSGPKSARLILGDPAVNFAVLECARGGILREGLAFDHCDVAIVTNVAADHLGLKGINTVQDMANVKSVLPKSVFREGYAILNADDDLVYAMAEELTCNVALFSLDPENPRLKDQVIAGGMAASIDNGYITIWKGRLKKHVKKVDGIPLTMGGRAGFMIQNVLAATLAAVVRNFSMEKIQLGLETFFPSPEQTPGRLNLFKFRDFEVMVDYAHNPHGLTAIKGFLEKTPGRHKVGIIAAAGDRRPEDMIEMGRLAAGMFDEIIVRQDKDLRGNSREQIEACFRQGIESCGGPEIKFIPDEKEAIAYAVRHAKENAFIVVCSEDVTEVAPLLNDLREQEKGVVA